jgi:hypothetical protein
VAHKQVVDLLGVVERAEVSLCLDYLALMEEPDGMVVAVAV